MSPAEAYERAADAVTPLWRLDYERQLAVKQARVAALLRQLATRLPQTAAAAHPKIPTGDGRRRSGLPCQLDRIVASVSHGGLLSSVLLRC